jgi:hypothetical protein
MNRIAAVIVGLVLLAPAANAQQQSNQPTPEQMQQMMAATFDSMVPYMGKMVEAMIQGQLRVLVRPETATQMAAYVRNFYDELVKQGFTEAQALQIASSLAIPSAAPPGQ